MKSGPARGENVLVFTDGAHEEKKGSSGAVIVNCSWGTHASGFYVDDAPIQLERHRGKKEQIGLFDFLSVIVAKCVFNECCTAANLLHISLTVRGHDTG